MTTITIEGKKYNVKFGYGAFKILCKLWNETKISALDKHLAKLQFADDPTIEQLDITGQLVLAGILNANSKASVTADDVVTALMFDVDVMQKIMTEFQSSMPKPDINPESRGK